MRETGSQFDSPGGGSGVIVEGPEGQRYRFVTDSKAEEKPVDGNRPIQLSHVVLNTRDWEPASASRSSGSASASPTARA